MTVARQKNQTARRKQLVDATTRAIAAKGLANLYMKDIAEEAAISERLVSYYYKNLDDLISAAHREAVDRYYWSRLKAITELDQPAEMLRRLISTGLPDGPDDAVSRVLYELSVSAGRHPDHSTIMSELFDLEVSLYQRVLDSGVADGHFTLRMEAVTLARTFVALEDAYGLHILARSSTLTRELATEIMTDYAEDATGAGIGSEAPPAEHL